MFQHSSFFRSAFILLGLLACTPSRQITEDKRPLVVATNSVLCDLTRQIGQDSLNFKCLVDAGVDPHVYQPTPADRQAIDTAKLILYGGYNFEPSLAKLIQATTNSASKVAVHEKAVPQPILGSSHEHEHEHEEEAEEKDNTPDPHVWHNPSNGMEMVNVISQELAKLQPDQAQVYQERAKEINDQINSIDQWIKTQIATIPPKKRKLVTTHDALGYYVSAYDLEFTGALSGLSTEESPTAARVSELTKDIEKTQVPTIFAETSINPQLIATIAKEAKVKVSPRELYADGLGEKGTEGDSYQKMLIANTKTLVEGLGGKYTPFPSP